MDHIQHDGDQQQPTRPACRRTALSGELREQQRDAAEDAADQHQIQGKEQRIAEAKVSLGGHAARERQQGNNQAHDQQRCPHGRQLFQRHAHPPTRQREQRIHRAAFLFAAQHAAAHKQRPEGYNQNRKAIFPGGIAAGGVQQRNRLGNPLKGSSQRHDGGTRRRPMASPPATG